MALPHADPGQVFDASPSAGSLSSDRTTALFKARDLEVIRLVLPAGKSLPPHQVSGEITIHCIEGSLEVQVGDTTVVLNAGQLTYLDGSAMHGVTARTDAAALVTIALKP
jgi:quercetin dioxygenase-like cupin family protein